MMISQLLWKNTIMGRERGEERKGWSLNYWKGAIEIVATDPEAVSMGIKTMADAGNENERAASHLSRSRREKVSLGKPQREKTGAKKTRTSFFLFLSPPPVSRFARSRSVVAWRRTETSLHVIPLAFVGRWLGWNVFEIETPVRDWTGLIWGTSRFWGARALREVKASFLSRVVGLRSLRKST